MNASNNDYWVGSMPMPARSPMPQDPQGFAALTSKCIQTIEHLERVHASQLQEVKHMLCQALAAADGNSTGEAYATGPAGSRLL